MIKYLKVIKQKIYYFLLKLSIIIKSLNKDCVYLIGTPKHGNLGDQAILQCELNIFKKIGSKNIVYVESSFVKNNIQFLKNIIKDKKIYVHGGGFLGTIWPDEEEMFRKIVLNFPNNKIIVFPQTIYFDKIDSYFEESKRIYTSNPNILYLTREIYSYTFMRNKMNSCKCVLVPDIVLFGGFKKYNYKRDNCLFCIRNDREKVSHNYEIIKNALKQYNLKCYYTDTVINKNIYSYNRKRILNSKLKQFSKYKLVITDRLHGMVFAYLTKTPCIVYENSSYKVKGLYKWIEQCNFIRLYNPKSVDDDIKKLLSISEKKQIDLSNYFSEIEDIIK